MIHSIHSIRWRVALATTAGVLVVASIAAGSWYSMAANVHRAELDREIDTKVRTLATLTRWNEGDIELEFSDELMPDYLPGAQASYFQVWRQDGSVAERSRSLHDGDFELPDGASESGAQWDLELPDKRPGRATALVFEVTEGFPRDDANPLPQAQSGRAFPRATIMVAQSRAGLDDNLRALRLSVLLVGFGLALGSALVVITFVSLGLRPLQRLGERVAALDPKTLPGSLHEGRLPTELEPIRQRLDELMQKVRDALERERRVAANIAHELRTPLSELQSVTEVAVRWPEGEEHRSRALLTSHGIAKRMSALTEAILRLSQPQSGEFHVDSERLCFTDLVREVWNQTTAEHGATGEIELLPDILVRSDRVALRIILTNLLENALEHGHGDLVHCELVLCEPDEGGPAAEFRVTNRAGELEAADLAKFGERFWRGDKTRTSGGKSHFGLGLAIAGELCSRIDAKLVHRLGGDRIIASVRVRLA